ncbi:MAG: HEPN domain-containing protein [Chloroflexaceae bacterium]|nr:HEPN domain-containing protein [Chloroflexaceae bacterium]
MSEAPAPLLAELRQQLQAHYGERLAGVVLFGSQARGDAEPGSDVDVLVVLRGAEPPAEEDRAFASALSYDLLLRYEHLASLLHTSLESYLHEQSPLMINIRREGVVLSSGEGGELQPLLDTAIQQPRERGNGMTPEQAALLGKAADDVRAARMLATQGMYDAAVSRAYYAMFSVAQAFLLGQGLAFSKHSAVIAAFGRQVAHAGLVPLELHRHLIDAQEARLQADYARKYRVLTEQEAIRHLSHAEAFLDVAVRLIGPVPPDHAS